MRINFDRTMDGNLRRRHNRTVAAISNTACKIWIIHHVNQS